MSRHLISTDLVPVGGFYLIFMGVLAAGLRLHRRGSVRGSSARGRLRSGWRRPGWLARRLPPGWPAFAGQIIATALAGYLLLMAVLTGYYYGVSRVKGNFLVSAVTGCALLAGLALPVFAAASWLAWWRRGRPARPADPSPGLPPPAGTGAGPGLIRE
jgi:hypothetical protein